MTTITQSPTVRSTPKTIYSYAVIVEPVANPEKERQRLIAQFNEPPFSFEIDQWAQLLTGNDYRVVDSFLLEEIGL